MTRRHFERYAPHIQIDVLHRVSDFYESLDQTDRLAQYNALLLDYRLPRENALEVLKHIRLSSHINIPVILITGAGDEELAVKALKMGAFDYITKNHGYLFKLPSVIENAFYSIRIVREHEALQESERRYRTLFEYSHVPMLLIDSDTSAIVDANPAAVRFYGWSHEQLNAKKMHAINTSKDEELKKIRGDILKEERNSFLFRHRRADGSLCDVEVYSSPIEIGGRKLLYSMVYDITERITIEKEKEMLLKKLLQAQKMEAFGQLAGGIAHDFNNILSSVLGFTELALLEVKKGSSIEDDLQEVFTAGKRAKELVQQILALARQTDEAIGPVVVSTIAKEVLKLIKPSTPSSIEIRQKFSSDSMVMGNAIQIHQIMMNLCSNAVYAMEETGVLEIGLNEVVLDDASGMTRLPLPPGNYIEITISDTGSGIPEDIIDSIFDPYFTTKPPGEGTGMGLAMVHGIIESYGGKIQVESALGRGTVFTIYLPVVQESLALPPDKLLDMPTGTERILLVDDEVPIAKLGGQILERLGYTVTVMTNSTDTLKLFASKPDAFDLVMADVTMPILTGDNLAIELMKVRPDSGHSLYWLQ